MEQEDAMMMMKMEISSPSLNSHSTIFSQKSITMTTCPSWKFYDNPFYNSHIRRHPVQEQDQVELRICNHKHHHLQNLRHRSSSSIEDLSLMKAVIESELDLARTQIIGLQAELDYERKARKRAESTNKRLGSELEDERREREAAERVCAQLVREVSFHRSEIDHMKKEIEEERKMLRVDEVVREEAVRTKLTDGKQLLEEKLSKIEGPRLAQNQTASLIPRAVRQSQREDKARVSSSPVHSSGKFPRMVLGERNNGNVDAADSREGIGLVLMSASCNETGRNGKFLLAGTERRASPKPENPHIKRGIKGFVEFPRVVQAIRSKSGRWGTKLEYQKAQLKILLKQTSPVRSNSPIKS